VAHDRNRRRKRDGSVDVTLDNEETLYFANVTLGTPAQSLRLHIDTGSSDLWTNSPNSTYCENSQNVCQGGTYDPTKSTTYRFVNSEFNISYVDGSGAVGDYATDVFVIGGEELINFQFGIGFQSSSAEGVLGIGYTLNEVQVNRAGLSPYPNLPQAMVNGGVIQSNAYSLWLNDLDSSTGTILFGGVNMDKYHGDLETVPIIKEYGEYIEFIIALTGITINTSSTSTTSLQSSSSLPAGVLLDSGSSLLYLPNDLAEDIFNTVDAVYDSNAGTAYVECSLANQDSSIDFAFGGQTISVPYNELVLDLASNSEGGQLTFENGQPACIFGIAPAEGSTPVLGDTFLRSAYVVYDLANNQISLAQTNFNSTTDDIREIGTGSGSVPGAIPVATAVTTVAAGTGGARLGGVSTSTYTIGTNPTSTSGGMPLPIPVALATALTCVGLLFACL